MQGAVVGAWERDRNGGERWTHGGWDSGGSPAAAPVDK